MEYFNFKESFLIKKVFLVVLVILLNSPANAGFWSSVAGGMVANSLTGSNSHSNGNNIDAKTDEKKIQQVLTKLGFYDSKIDGDLNSFESRTAISKFQKFYLAEETGVLTNKTFTDLLYMHDLFKKYKEEFKQAPNANNAKLKQIYIAFNKLEDKIRNNNMTFVEKVSSYFSKPNYLSSKLKKDFKQEILRKKELLKSFGLTEYSKDLFFDDNLVWQDMAGLANNRKTWFDANTYCSNLDLGGASGWRLPTRSDFYDLHKKINQLKHLEAADYWTSDERESTRGNAAELFTLRSYHVSQLNNWIWKNRYNAVRCVKDKL